MGAKRMIRYLFSLCTGMWCPTHCFELWHCWCCLQGGSSSWWKYKFCYGKQVIQFHEDVSDQSLIRFKICAWNWLQWQLSNQITLRWSDKWLVTGCKIGYSVLKKTPFVRLTLILISWLVTQISLNTCPTGKHPLNQSPLLSLHWTFSLM